MTWIKRMLQDDGVSIFFILKACLNRDISKADKYRDINRTDLYQ